MSTERAYLSAFELPRAVLQLAADENLNQHSVGTAG